MLYMVEITLVKAGSTLFVS